MISNSIEENNNKNDILFNYDTNSHILFNYNSHILFN